MHEARTAFALAQRLQTLDREDCSDLVAEQTEIEVSNRALDVHDEVVAINAQQIDLSVPERVPGQIVHSNVDIHIDVHGRIDEYRRADQFPFGELDDR